MNGLVDSPDDWTTLAAEWQEGPPAVAIDATALRNRVEADRQRMRWALAAEVALSLFFIAGTVVTVRRYPGSWSGFLAFDVIAMLVAMWAFALWNARGTWRPLGQTTEAFIGLARLRCVRRLRALRYAAVITVVQLVGVLAWSRNPGSSGGAPAMPDLTLLLPAAVVATVVVVIVTSRRRIRRELAELDALSVELLPDR